MYDRTGNYRPDNMSVHVDFKYYFDQITPHPPRLGR